MSTIAKNGKAGSTRVTETPPDASQTIRLEPLEQRTLLVPVRGVTPVIPHKWAEKSLRMMRDKQSGSTVRAKHTAKDGIADAEAATYYLEDGTPGIQATAFKAAIADATRFFQGITAVMAKQAFFVEGDGEDQLVRLNGSRTLREDTPRNNSGVVDLRYRYAYWPWSVVLPITFLPVVIDAQSVLALVNAAGFGGVGDWRPSSPKSKSGTFGRFEVDVDAEIGQL